MQKCHPRPTKSLRRHSKVVREAAERFEALADEGHGLVAERQLPEARPHVDRRFHHAQAHDGRRLQHTHKKSLEVNGWRLLQRQQQQQQQQQSGGGEWFTSPALARIAIESATGRPKSTRFLLTASRATLN